MHLQDSMQLLVDRYDYDLGLLNRMDEARIDKKAAIKTRIAPLGYDIRWFTLGYKIANKNFYLYDSLQPYDKQVSKENFVAHQVSGEFNRFRWDTNAKCSMFTIGAAVIFDDTKDGLAKTELSESRVYKKAINARTGTTKYTAFIGNYKDDILAFKLYIDWYKFITSNKAVAIHLYPETTLRYELKSITSAGVGLFFTFVDKKDEKQKAKVNAEVYCKFNDLNNNLELKNYKFYERNDIGIRVTFPLNFTL
jgi:hypothetical protein